MTSSSDLARWDAPISADVVRHALRAIRYSQPLVASPLLGLDSLTVRLREHELADTPQAREWLLSRYLSEIALKAIGPTSSERTRLLSETHAVDAELELLHACFADASTDRQSWALLYCRFLGHCQIPLANATRRLGISARSLARRTQQGIVLMVSELTHREDASRAFLSNLPGAPAHERLIVDAAAADHQAEDLHEGLLEVVRHNAKVIRVQPQQMRELVRRKAATFDEYWLGRLAEWSQPRYLLDERFVDLSLLVDLGEDMAAIRWLEQEQRYGSLRDVIDASDAPALVLLGRPGCGKSTLLRHFEMTTAADCLRGDCSAVTFFIQLSRCPAASPWSDSMHPIDWLGRRWELKFPDLPSLDSLLADGRMVLLLDALNEMPHRDDSDYRDRVRVWKQALAELAQERPGNRIILTCRSLDYSAPLSSPSLRVPQVRVEPLDDQQIQRFLHAYAPACAELLWEAMSESPHLDVLRAPFFLRLLAERAVSDAVPEPGAAALFTEFVRSALRREVARDNPLFTREHVLTAHDCRRVTHARAWRTPHDLPEHGPLIPSLTHMAFAMQSAERQSDGAQLRVGFDQALSLIGDTDGGDVLAAGGALGVLDEDADTDEVMFVHQLLQEYFSARRLAREPSPELVSRPWRADQMSPPLDQLVEDLPLAEPLPPVPTTGWEETTLLAAAMARDADSFVRGVSVANLALAGRCAATPELDGSLGDETLKLLRTKLAQRTECREADLRDRIACARALGRLGDHRFSSHSGPYGEYLLPPFVTMDAGPYTIGEDEPYGIERSDSTDHCPSHVVDLEAFRVGRFPVTNAEWQYFIESGGYADERWWQTEDARSWFEGHGTALGLRQGLREARARVRGDMKAFERRHATGLSRPDMYALWLRRALMSDDEYEAYIRELHPDEKQRHPNHWMTEPYAVPNQPVIGICWYEALAYCAWLEAQTELPVRLPTEVEWEAAARGPSGRRYSYGDTFEPLKGNVNTAHVRGLTPVGVFLEGDTVEGVSDLGGNTRDWTCSLWGSDANDPAFRYPYDPSDGREDLEASWDVRRVVRGAGWGAQDFEARGALRARAYPHFRSISIGLRLVYSVR